MYSVSDIKRFKEFCAPLVKHGSINQELYLEAIRALENHIKDKLGENKSSGNSTPLPTLLTRSEVAKILKCSEKQIDRLRKSGKLRTVRYSPRSVLIRLEDVERLISTPY